MGMSVEPQLQDSTGPAKYETLSDKWERIRSRGYWVSYWLIPLLAVSPAIRSYERHDGHLWVWLTSAAVCMIAAILRRPTN